MSVSVFLIFHSPTIGTTCIENNYLGHVIGMASINQHSFA
jgi:hypothetical protein